MFRLIQRLLETIILNQILVGERDKTGKVKQYNKAWSKRTGIKIIWIPNAAHNSNVDNPEFVNSCIEEFLADL